jgi:hypothetical protein
VAADGRWIKIRLKSLLHVERGWWSRWSDLITVFADQTGNRSNFFLLNLSSYAIEHAGYPVVELEYSSFTRPFAI